MFDRKARSMLMLAMLNDVYSDAAISVRNLKDFVASHPEMADEFEEFGFNELIDAAENFEKVVLEVMDKLKKVIY